MYIVGDKSVIKLHNHSIIYTSKEYLGNEARFPNVITTVQCSSICSQLNNKPRVYIVVTDFRLHHTCSDIIILWLHSLSGVIRSLLCNPCAFSTGIIKWVELARNRNKWLGRTRHPYIRAVHARYHARTCAQIRKRCGIVT